MTTWNPSDKSSEITLSGGDLTATADDEAGSVRSTTSKSTGKHYFELTALNDDASNSGAGVLTASSSINDGPLDWNPGAGYFFDGNIVVDGNEAANATNWMIGDVLGVALDLTNNLIYFSINGVYQAGGNPAAGTGGISITPGTYFAGFGKSSNSGSCAVTVNFGGTSFNTPPPTGYLAWDSGIIIHNLEISVAQGKSATVLRSSGKRLSVDQGKTASLIRNSRKILSVSQDKVATLIRGPSIALESALTKAADLIVTRGRASSIQITQDKSASLDTQFAITRAFTVTQDKVAELGNRAIEKFVNVAQDKIAVLAKNLNADAITVTQDKVADLIKAPGKVLQATQDKAASLIAQAGKSRAFTVTQAKTALLRRGVNRLITVTQSKTASLARQYAKNVEVTIIQVKTAALRVRGHTSAVAVQILKNVITRQRIMKNVVTRVRILKNVVTRRH